MRGPTARQKSENIIEMGISPVGMNRIGRLGLLGVLLVTMLGSRITLAEPAALATAPSSPQALAQVPVFVESPEAVAADSFDPFSDSAEPGSLEDLLSVPQRSLFRSAAEIADETIAAAVEQGSRPDLERKSGFRKKRKIDLFRTERPVEIGDQEMVLRLRVRAKLKRAMSVELRF